MRGGDLQTRLVRGNVKGKMKEVKKKIVKLDDIKRATNDRPNKERRTRLTKKADSSTKTYREKWVIGIC